MRFARALWRGVAPVFRWLGYGAALLSVLLLLLSLASLILCDRVESIYMILYVPTLPISVGTLLFYLLFRKKSFPRRLRCWVLALNMVVLLWSIIPMIGWRPCETFPRNYTPVRIIQWNVMSGGQYRNRRLPFLGDAERLKAKLRDAPADVLIFSEAPSGQMVDELLTQLGPEWNARYVSGFPDRQNKYDFDYFARSMVMTRYPQKRPTSTDIPHGVLCRFEVQLPSRTMRILMVDGDSRPYHKAPFLSAVAEEIRKARTEGRPYDVVCGDFNAISRSTGFADISGAGYKDASRYGYQWRGTFPVVCPLLDIDHVYVEQKNVVNRFDVFYTLASDHCGHDVTIGLAP